MNVVSFGSCAIFVHVSVFASIFGQWGSFKIGPSRAVP
jgi:hypothetical protein